MALNLNNLLISNTSHLDSIVTAVFVPKKKARLTQYHNDLCTATLYLIVRYAQVFANRLELLTVI